MRRATREPEAAPTTSSHLLLRWGGVGASLAGVLFAVWGFVHKENDPLYLKTMAHVLALIVPVLFMVGLTTLYARCAGRAARFGEAGIILGSIGSALGTEKGLVEVAVPSLYPHNPPSDRIRLLLDIWTPAMFAGLLLGGFALAATTTLRSLRALLLAMGVFGWAYYVTDSGAILEERLIHVGFGLLFCLGWVALGLTLWLAGTEQVNEPPM